MSLTPGELTALRRQKKLVYFGGREDERLANFLKYLSGKNLIYSSYTFQNDANQTVQMYIDGDGMVNIDGPLNIQQSAFSEDHDVVSISKNTSFVDYTSLSRTYYTKIGGTGNEYTNPRVACTDNSNNLYVCGEANSERTDFFDSTNNTVPVSEMANTEEAQNIFLAKYNHLGEFQWRVRVDSTNDIYFPTVATDGTDTYLCFQCNDGSGTLDLSIYDTTSETTPVQEMEGVEIGSAIILRFNAAGVLQWKVQLETQGTDWFQYPRIALDTNGNVFFGSGLQGTSFRVIDTDQRLNDRVFTVSTSTSYVLVALNSSGVFQWNTHVALPSIEEDSSDGADEALNVAVTCDGSNNIILLGNFRERALFYNKRISNPSVPLPNPLITLLAHPPPGGGDDDEDDSVFLAKYSPQGQVQWATKIANFALDVSIPQVVVDSQGSIYVACELEANEYYIYDTTNRTSPRYTLTAKEGEDNILLLKYNTSGVVQWYTIMDGPSYDEESRIRPSIALDERTVDGEHLINVYVSGETQSPVNFYNAMHTQNIAYTLPYTDPPVSGSITTFLGCFDGSGRFRWATRTVSNRSMEDPCVQTDRDGHVYYIGQMRDNLYIFDSRDNQNPVATLRKSNGTSNRDLFIIKYNRYGMLNVETPRALYIEDNTAIPDSFPKQIVLTDNEHHGLVNLYILQQNPDFGYSIRRTVALSEYLELTTKSGKWIPKLQLEQNEYTNDLDVVDVNTGTSFIDYRALQNTFYTRIGGGSDDLNPQMGIDEAGNVYMAGVYGSSELNIYDSTNNTVPVANLYNQSEQALFLTKYNTSGQYQWRVRVDGYDAKSEPSVYTNSRGETFVAVQSYDDDDISIFDSSNPSTAVKELEGSVYDVANTVVLKFDPAGRYVWNIRVRGVDDGDVDAISTSVITGDQQGNIYVAGYYNGTGFEVFDTSADGLSTPTQTLSNPAEISNGYYLCRFDPTGRVLWLNHLTGGVIPNQFGPPDIFKLVALALNTDADGDLYLTANYYSAISLYTAGSNTVVTTVPHGTDEETSYGLGCFTVKYTNAGSPIWNTHVLGVSSGMFSGTWAPSTCVDADGNLYMTFTNAGVDRYEVYDTRIVSSQPVYTYTDEATEVESFFVSILKFNPNGIHQWTNMVRANRVDDFKLVWNPVITCDNRFVRGQDRASIYVHMSGIVDDYQDGFRFYNASSLSHIAYTLPSKDWYVGDTMSHGILAKYNLDGDFQWATTSACYGYYGEGFNGVSSTSVQATQDGHVYVAGSYYDNDLGIWDVSTNGAGDAPRASLSYESDFDIYLIKYNRFGLLNTSTHRNIYLEDRAEVPNAFEKSIVITHNDNAGPVDCLILEPLGTGFGHRVRRTVVLQDAVDMVMNAGLWIPKIPVEQPSLSVDQDVIDINTKLSILDYDTLGSTSWATRIAGDGDERNMRMGVDRANNLYFVASYTTNNVRLYEFESGYNTVPRNGTRDVLLGKYNPQGVGQWRTHISFDTDIGNNTPTIHVDGDGNSYICIVKTSDFTANNLYIFDTRDNYTSQKTVPLNNSSTTVVKYGSDGVYLWDASLTAYFTNTDGTDSSTIAVDSNGAVYITGYIQDHFGVNVRDTSGTTMATLYRNVSNGMFLVKLDKIGKYQWAIALENGIYTGAKSAVSCDPDGNVVITGLQNDTVRIRHIVNETTPYLKDLTLQSGYVGLFMVKYDTTGRCLWTNVLTMDTSAPIDVVTNPVTTIDAYGNLYLATQIQGEYIYIYDTRNDSSARETLSIPTQSTANTFLAKYNANGIVQWYTFVSGYSTIPSISVDNRFVRGINRNSVYLSGAYLGDEGGYLYLYDAVRSGYPNQVAVLTEVNWDAFLIRFDGDDGALNWCSKVGGSAAEVNNSVVATSDGHVYFAGEFNSASVDVYQGWSFGMNPNTDVATTISNLNSGNFDIFLIKYNRYGTVNNGGSRNGREVYLENHSDIPDGTEKSIVIINNVQNGTNVAPGNVCLLVIERDYPGYEVFRTLWFSEGVTMVSYGGQWFMKSGSTGDGLPKRSIVMWGGDQTDIPLGWRLCDGGSLNGVTTPDLRGRFVLGYNPDVVVAVDSTGSRAPQLAIGTVGGELNHTLTNSEMPIHNHGGSTGSGGWGTTSANPAVSLTTMDVADDNGNHTHSIANDGGGLTHNNMPPYFVLAYIMKCY